MTPGRRPIGPLDLLRMNWVSDPVFRPHLRQRAPQDDVVAFTRTSVDPVTWRYRSHILSANETGVEALTDGSSLDRAPRWSPDGRLLAFVSDRSGSSQVWLRDSDANLTRVTDIPLGVTGAPLWLPDGSGVIVNAPERVEPPVGRPGEPPPTVRVIRRLDYRADPAGVAHGARGHVRGFRDGRRQQIWWASTRGGSARQLTHGDFEHLRPRVSPDGTLVAFTSKRSDDADRTIVKDLWVVPVAGGDVRRVGGGWGPIEELAWSPDGTRLTFTGHLMGDRGSDRTEHHVIVVDLNGGTPVALTEGFEPALGVWVRGDSRLGGTLPGLEWTETGIHFIASERGASHVYRIEASRPPETLAPGARIRRLTEGPRTVSAFSVDRDGGLAFVSEDATQPCDLYVLRDGTAERRLTHSNDDFLREVELSAPRHFTFPGTLGQAVDAWIMPPVSHEPGRRYPVVLETHRGAFGHGFFFEFQALAAAGFAVLYCNHVGAQGYGQDYAHAQHGRWGGPDVDEMLRCIDAAASIDFVDKDRTGTMGLSAGGFYTNWLMAEPRFKAGVSEAGIYNWLSKFGTSDIGFPYVIAENSGLPWERRDAYWQMSPISRVERITAPLLIIHADEDYRVDISESEQLFQALRHLGRPVEFLWFKGETHGFSRIGQPVNRIERLRRIIDWFARHL